MASGPVFLLAAYVAVFDTRPYSHQFFIIESEFTHLIHRCGVFPITAKYPRQLYTPLSRSPHREGLCPSSPGIDCGLYLVFLYGFLVVMASIIAWSRFASERKLHIPLVFGLVSFKKILLKVNQNLTSRQHVPVVSIDGDF